MKIRFALVNKKGQILNQVGADGWTTKGPIQCNTESFFEMQNRAFHWRMHGVMVWIKPIPDGQAYIKREK